MSQIELPALISLHDVMPETFPDVVDVLHMLDGYGIPPITLLVVPGKAWRKDHLDYLREWSRLGYTLAAHGWSHQADRINGLYHRLHSWLLSRNVAEHLAWEPEAILGNMSRALSWFVENNLPVPNFYVPPAWALGKIHFPMDRNQRQQLDHFPKHVELLSGILNTQTGALHKLPLVGYEADTAFREWFVRKWNRVQLSKARRVGAPVRVGLHPFDFNLRLSSDLQALLSSPNLTPIDFNSWLENL